MELWNYIPMTVLAESVEARLQDAAQLQPGAGSAIVTTIGKLAAGLRWAGSHVESWAKGASDGGTVPGTALRAR